MNTDLLWRAEWNWMDAQRRRGTVSDALDRLGALRSEWQRDAARVPPALQVRLAWLDARLALDGGRLDQVPGLCNDILLLIDSLSGRLDSIDLEALRSNVLLMQGEALLRLQQAEPAGVVFRELRENYPESGAAILSFLIEAREQSAQDGLVSAQQSLIRLADLFPRSRFAPLALWEAAVNAQQRETTSTYQEAITILERLINDYPDHYLAYFARLKQADLSRLLNDFGTALLLYENLLNQFPNHPDRFRALMGVADTLLARGSQNPIHFMDAAAHYERVFAMGMVPVEARFEAGLKSMVALRNAGSPAEAEAAFWNIMSLASAEGFFYP
ncbi:MAG: tetratricopeptide repeat protein [Verrucomicrobia bacterium]|nr:tetratricopeptide repeat protein [Verrucomicrobiota bacterium]